MAVECIDENCTENSNMADVFNPIEFKRFQAYGGLANRSHQVK
jgi:hypothetical protein